MAATNTTPMLSNNNNNIGDQGGGGSDHDQGGEPSVLQKHVMFFDTNKDGLIYPWETFHGFRAIGTGIFISLVGAVFVNTGLSPPTRPGKGFSILFPIEVANIAKGKHGSATDTYDTEGRFVESKFEDIFAKHAHTSKDYLTSDELSEMLKANREPKNLKGWVANFAEWKFLFHIAKDKQGHLQKETIRDLFTGDLFYRLAEQKANSKNKHKGNGGSSK